METIKSLKYKDTAKRATGSISCCCSWNQDKVNRTNEDNKEIPGRTQQDTASGTKIYQLQPISSILKRYCCRLCRWLTVKTLLFLWTTLPVENESNQSIYRGIGKYHTDVGDFIELLDPSMIESIRNARCQKDVDIGRGVIFPLVNEFHKSME